MIAADAIGPDAAGGHVRPAVPIDIPVLTAIHAACFDSPWGADSLMPLLIGPGGFGLVATDTSGAPVGLVFARCAADEAEILTLCVLPEERRGGHGFRLLRGAMEHAATCGAATLFLEVADDNEAALALYRRAGFAAIGTRPRYYGARTALMMSAPLPPPPVKPF
ncbi:MAG: GNAT family N-acetyltransferase [Inquilinaceae bacterium]